MNRRIRHGLIAGALALGAVAAGAGPALAGTPPTPGSGNVSATVTIPGTLTFTLADTSFALTGTPGQPSNVGTVHWSITTNDGSGWGVTVQAAKASLTGTGTNSSVIPIHDVAVLQASQNLANGWTTPPSFLNWDQAQELSSTAATTVDGDTHQTASTLAAYDYYAIPGAVLSTGDGGMPIPNVPADTYSDTLNYVAFGN